MLLINDGFFLVEVFSVEIKLNSASSLLIYEGFPLINWNDLLNYF